MSLIEQSAIFDDERRHRFWLSRDLRGLPGRQHTSNGLCVFVMLNPSTADESVNDPTIRRCIDFAARWHFTHLGILNLWSLRATDPRALIASEFEREAHGRNVEVFRETVVEADLLVAGWGANVEKVRHPRPPIEAMARARTPLVCLGTTKAGHPRHPLYLARTTHIQPFGPSAG